MNRLKMLERLNFLFGILVLLFSVVASFQMVEIYVKHGWSYTEKVVEDDQIVDQSKTLAPICGMLFFLYAVFTLFFMNSIFLRKLEPQG